MRSIRGAAALILGASLVVASCGDDDDDTGSADEADESEESAEETDGAETVAITAADYRFEDVPDTVAAGSTLTLTNTSDAELHELVALRIPDDEERSVAELVELPEDELDAIFPEDEPPAMVVIAPPGGEGSPVVGDGTLTEPGRYALVCFIPVGADPEEFMTAMESGDGEGPPDVAGGPPHAVEGMVAEIVVE